MSLDNIAEQIGTLTDEQTDSKTDRVLEFVQRRRNLNDYHGAFDPEGRSDREA